MEWKIKNDIKRGYGFEYDDLNRLVFANYSDGNALDDHADHFSVAIDEYDLESEPLIIPVTMPKSKIFIYNIFQSLIDHFLSSLPMIQLIFHQLGL